MDSWLSVAALVASALSLAGSVAALVHGERVRGRERAAWARTHERWVFGEHARGDE